MDLYYQIAVVNGLSDRPHNASSLPLIIRGACPSPTMLREALDVARSQDSDCAVSKEKQHSSSMASKSFGSSWLQETGGPALVSVQDKCRLSSEARLQVQIS